MTYVDFFLSRQLTDILPGAEMFPVIIKLDRTCLVMVEQMIRAFTRNTKFGSPSTPGVNIACLQKRQSFLKNTPHSAVENEYYFICYVTENE